MNIEYPAQGIPKASETQGARHLHDDDTTIRDYQREVLAPPTLIWMVIDGEAIFLDGL